MICSMPKGTYNIGQGQLMIPSLALFQAEAQLSQSLLSGSCKEGICMAFVDLEKAFDRVHRKVFWWALRKLGVWEWIMRLVQGMYANAALHHCAWSLVMKVPLWDLLGGPLLRWPLIIAESLEECVRMLLSWKEAMEEKGLRVNAGKTKIMICGMGLDLLQSSGAFPCAVCRTGVGSHGCWH